MNTEKLEFNRIAENTVLFSITTAGYAVFTLNLHASLCKLGLGKSLVVFCLDNESNELLRNKGLCTVSYEELNTQSWADFNSTGFAEIVSTKFTIASELMRKGLRPMYVDSDVVFLRDPVCILSDLLEHTEADLVMQYEIPKQEYNTGFWMCKPSELAIESFENIGLSLRNGKFTDDQDYVNQGYLKTGILKCHPLDYRTFLSGAQIFASPTLSKSAYIMHFNYVSGRDRKIHKMKKHGGIFSAELERQSVVPDHKPVSISSLVYNIPKMKQWSELFGFHAIETHNGRKFRWSCPESAIQLQLVPGDYIVYLDMDTLIGLCTNSFKAFINNTPLSRKDYKRVQNGIVFYLSMHDFDGDTERYLQLEFDRIDTSDWETDETKELGAPMFALIAIPI